MTDKEKKSEKQKVPTRRRDVSTFSKLIENQEKEFEKFIRSIETQSHLEKIIELNDISQGILADLDKLNSDNFVKLITDQSIGTMHLYDDLIKLQEVSKIYLLEQLGNSKSILDSVKVFENSLSSIGFADMKKLEGTLMNIPTDNFHTSIDKHRTLDIELKEIQPIKNMRNEFLLKTRTQESIEIGKIQLRTIQETNLHVQSLKGEVKEIKETIVEDGKKKDEMLEELLEFARTGGNSLVRIKKLKYNKKSAELIIDNKSIKIQADTNQHYLCKILFNSKTSIKKDWEICDIVEALGEDTTILNDWQEIIYNTVRHLNHKIQSVTGLERFILYSNKKVMVNPNYIDLN